MLRVNATNFKNHLGRYLEYAIREPVIVEKSGRASAVLVSFNAGPVEEPPKVLNLSCDAFVYPYYRLPYRLVYSC